jgi:hypothetical protein
MFMELDAGNGRNCYTPKTEIKVWVTKFTWPL